MDQDAGMSSRVRPAVGTDIDALVAIEQAAFAGDRISRRSFRQLIERETAAAFVAEVAGRVAGYAMVLFRKGSGVARLYSIARASDRPGLGPLLLQTAENAAYDRERLLLRLEVREDNHRAIALYRQNGYRRIGREPGYYHDGMAALRFEKTLRGAHPPVTGVPYYRQSWDFTCGPCCLMMAAGHFLPGYEADRTAELRLWRQATTVFMMSGAGGCEPFGLAVAAHDIGLSAEIFVSAVGPLFLQSVRSHEKRSVMEVAQADFRRRAAALDIPTHTRAFSLDDIRACLSGGGLAMVLVSGYLMFGQKVPHWVLVIADDGTHVTIHDPWVEDERGETMTDAASIPVPYAIFMRMAQFGSDGLRAAVMLKRQEER